MQPSPDPIPWSQLILATTANIACAMIAGLCAALPLTAAAYALAVGASCLTAAGCQEPTFLDALIPTTAIASWAITALLVGVRQIRLLVLAIRTRPALTLENR